MKDELAKTPGPRTRRAVSSKQPSRSRAVLPLPADAVDAAFADGVQLEIDREQSANESLTYSEVVANVTEQLDQLEAQRVQLKKLLELAANTLS